MGTEGCSYRLCTPFLRSSSRFPGGEQGMHHMTKDSLATAIPGETRFNSGFAPTPQEVTHAR